MRIDRISAARRRKSMTQDRQPEVFSRWNASAQRYDFGFTIRNINTGEKYEVVADQLEWETAITDMRIYFRDAPA